MSFKMQNKTFKLKAALPHSQELKCKNGCGFFGNPEWQGYCSICFKGINQEPGKKHKGKNPAKLARSHSDAHERSLSMGFSKFEEKKKQQSDKRSKTIKSIIKRGHSSKESNVQSPLRELLPHIEDFQLGKEIPPKEAIRKDVLKQIQTQLEFMIKVSDKSIDEQSELMQDFYQLMLNRFENNALYQDMTAENVELLMDKIEKNIMTYLYRSTFQQISTECEDKDLVLQKRIRSLNWITSQHLGIEIKDSSPEVRELIDRAITDIIEMDSKQAPQEKLSCVVNCSKNICNIILLCQDAPASADEFFPAVVYIVLKANPPLLQSNIKYIMSYSIPTRYRSGESGYYFTNLCCAVAFIESLTAESLNLSSDEFERYLSGEAVPSGYSEQCAADCEGLRRMYQNLATLNELHERHLKLMEDITALQDSMADFRENTLKKLPPLSESLINPTPYTIPADVDLILVPEPLRNRICRQPKEDILIDISGKSTFQTALIAECESDTKNGTAEEGFQNISLECGADESLTTNLMEQTHAPLSQPDSFLAAQDTILTPVTYSQHDVKHPIVNIKDLEYPTELIPEQPEENCNSEELSARSPPTHNLSFLCEQSEIQASFIPDPLLPELGIIEDNLNLPPPLMPIVIQGNDDGSKDKSVNENHSG